MDHEQNSENNSSQRTAAEARSVAGLLPIMAAVFISFIIIGLALPVLPLHVHQGLGTFIVGLVAGSQLQPRSSRVFGPAGTRTSAARSTPS